MKVFATLFSVFALAGPMLASPLPDAMPEAEPQNGLGATTYQRTVTRHHNVHRANHSAPNILWGPNMAKYGLTLAQRCVFQHNTSINDYGESYGQNLQIGSAPAQVAEAITNGFYNSEVQNFAGQYGKPSPDLSKFGGWGHFSQLVWKGSQKVGCSTYNCASQGGIKDSNGNVIQGITWFTVCNYYPAGNVLGIFDKNVGKPLGRPTVGANY